MTKNILDNQKIRDALKTYLEQCVLDLMEISTQEQIAHLLKTKLVFDDGESCYAVGTTIVIGANFPYFNKTSPNLCYRQVQAAILHELAHNYLTNFEVYRKFIIRAPQKYGVNSQLAKSIANILEDYRIERRMSAIIPFGKTLFFTLRISLINNLYGVSNSKTQDIESEINYILNSMLMMGYTESFIETDSKRLNTLLNKVMKLVLQAKYAQNTEGVIVCSEKIVRILCEEYEGEIKVSKEVKVFLGKVNEKGTKTPNEAVPEFSSDDTGTAYVSTTNEGVLDITKNLNSEEIIEQIAEQYKRLIESVESEDITAQLINEYLYLKESEMENEEIKFEEITKIKEIAKNNPKTKALKLKIEDQIDSQYTDLQYERIKEPLQQEINEVVAALSEVKEEKENEYEEELKYGDINKNDLYKFAAYKENNIFQTPLDEQESIDLEIMLLIDESGSNGSKVLNTKNNVELERYKLNRMLAIFLHEILRDMKWRHTVWSFYSQSDTEVITPLLSPDNSLTAKGLNFANVYAKGSNRDGFHIRVAGEYMARESEGDRKLLIVLSDGQPSASNYNGKSAIKDVQLALKEVSEKNVSVIGVFSGDPIENKYFAKSESNPQGMYEKAIFLNNEKLFEFKEVFKDMLIEFYQSE